MAGWPETPNRAASLNAPPHPTKNIVPTDQKEASSSSASSGAKQRYFRHPPASDSPATDTVDESSGPAAPGMHQGIAKLVTPLRRNLRVSADNGGDQAWPDSSGPGVSYQVMDASPSSKSTSGEGLGSALTMGSSLPSPERQRRPALISPTSIRVGPQRDGNWRQRAVSFALPSHNGDPFIDGKGRIDVPAIPRPSSAVASNTRATPEGSPTSDDETAYRPREDRAMVQISGDNAQALFPPNACVFVANLVANLADEQLEFSVMRAFEQFGKVYVKIKRDTRGMPYAFCQYENVTDSERAIQYGRGMMIDGRQCRTERAKVNRSLYLSRTTGGPISEEEARQILAGHGDLEKTWTSSPTDKEMFRLPEGIWVTFAFFQDCRDAQALFKDSTEYRLEQPSLPEDIRLRLNRTMISPMTRATPVRSHHSSPMDQIRHLFERSTVFVGNLPANVNQFQLRSLFAQCGNVRIVEIISRQSFPNNNIDTFAFLHFSSEEAARRAVSAERVLDGFRLRVEFRESSDHSPGFRESVFSVGSPRARRPAHHHDISRGMINREAAISRAIAAGVHPSLVVQIFDPNGLENGELVHASPPAQSLAQLPFFSPFYANSPGPYPSPGGNTADGEITAHAYGSVGHVAAAGSVGSFPYSPMSCGPFNSTNFTAPPPFVFPGGPEHMGPATPGGGLEGHR